MLKNYSTILSLLAVLALPIPAAIAEEPVLPEEPPRVSLQVGLGTSFFPRMEWSNQAQVGYRLPWLDNSFEVNLSYLGSLLFLQPDQIFLNGKLYLLPTGDFQPHLSFGVGFMPALTQDDFAFNLAAGLDWRLSRNFAWVPEVSVAIPPARPTVFIINTLVAGKWYF